MAEDDNIAKEESLVKTKEETSLTNADYQRNRLFKKGILHMADEKLEEACRDFEMILRADPNDVDDMNFAMPEPEKTTPGLFGQKTKPGRPLKEILPDFTDPGFDEEFYQ